MCAGVNETQLRPFKRSDHGSKCESSLCCPARPHVATPYAPARPHTVKNVPPVVGVVLSVCIPCACRARPSLSRAASGERGCWSPGLPLDKQDMAHTHTHVATTNSHPPGAPSKHTKQEVIRHALYHVTLHSTQLSTQPCHHTLAARPPRTPPHTPHHSLLQRTTRLHSATSHPPANS